ncbi:acylphosphatase [Halobacillus salinarum]|uniref:Acylphosphatase n=1 Tax=Halobacillus salinarum TaxID=2932257 RepID=A0ABY4EFF1_9BACI|nr:acylphosphatase [Halobacillus salinarum]UOQ42793.1 acylphosphatase [Halobacillus salinarum]
MAIIQIIVHGQVQGVGFRATTKNIADQYQIKGWVKNTADGSVEIEAEGESQNLEEFISEIKKGPTPFAKVEAVNTEQLDASKGHKSFKIVH